MADWLSSMKRTFEYYIVDPETWKDTKKLNNVKSCTINWDSGAETLGSGSLSVEGTLGECYVRVYMIIIQNGVKEKRPLATLLVQTPSSSYDGKVETVTVDAYTPLLELKENPPPLGYSVLKGENVMDTAYRLTREQVRAPIVPATNSTTLSDDFVANTDEKWMSFITDLIANAKYEFGLDEMGRVLYLPKQDTASLQPVWTYNDDNSSILLPDFNIDRDLYGIPNVVEVIYSNGGNYLYSRAVNDDSNSPTSTVSRGRTITYRESSPSFYGNPTQKEVDEYAQQLLRNLSTLEYTVSYTHGYCPVRIGDCVRLNYTRAKITNVKAKVISQSIKCDTECLVSEKAVFTVKLFGGDQNGFI